MLYDRLPLILLLLCVSCSAEQAQQSSPPVERTLEYDGSVHILSDRGDTLSTLRVAIADTDESRQAGLMNVRSLPQDHGMLFVFDQQEILSFWMANTPLSLDIIFADSSGTVVRIHRNTQPYSDRSLESVEPALYALEALAGFAMENDIQEGAQIVIEGGQ